MTAAKRPYRIDLYRDAKGEVRWHMRAPNGRIVADSGEGYATPGSARKAVVRLVDAIQDGGMKVVIPDFKKPLA